MRCPKIAELETLSSKTLHIGYGATMNGSDAARKNIERGALCPRATHSAPRVQPDRAPRWSRPEKLHVGAPHGEDHIGPRLVERRNLFGAHAHELFTVRRGWRRTGRRHAQQSVCDYFGRCEAKLHGSSGETAGAATTATR